MSAILTCEACEPHTPVGRVRRENFLASLPILLRRFYTSSRPFVRILTVARVRKKYDCFAVYEEPDIIIGFLYFCKMGYEILTYIDC